MTVSSSVVKQVYSGNGSTRVFPIPFPYKEASDIGVYFTAADGTLSEVTTNINIDSVLNEVTYPVDTLILAPIPTGTKLTIIRETPITQEMDLENYGYFVPQVIEEAFDKVTRAILDLNEKISRCVSFPADSTPTLYETQNYLQTLTDLKNLTLQYKNDALASANSAESSYDSFDDRYLGAKSADPTTDNDGNVLLAGAIYFNTSVKKMRVWTGTFWDNIGSIATQLKYVLSNNHALSDIAGFILDSTLEKSAFFRLEIERVGAVEYRQIIEVQAVYDQGSWILTFGNYSGSDLLQSSLTSDESVVLSITNLGQLQYATGNLPSHVRSSIKVYQTRMEA